MASFVHSWKLWSARIALLVLGLFFAFEGLTTPAFALSFHASGGMVRLKASNQKNRSPQAQTRTEDFPVQQGLEPIEEHAENSTLVTIAGPALTGACCVAAPCS
ncbi:MAG: hypothetical protein AABZ47_05805, partial [Planctomycetota bacterium]